MLKQIRNIVIFMSIILLSGYILLQGGVSTLQNWAENSFLPGMVHVLERDEEKKWTKVSMERLFPLYQYVNANAPITSDVEDELTYELILAQQANDEYSMSEDLEEASQGVTQNQKSTIDMSIEKLRDFNYLLNTFYTVDSTTSIGPEQLNADDLLSRNMQLNTSTKGPKVLIFHTHSQETFVDSVVGDSSTSIVGMEQYTIMEFMI